MKVKVSWSTQRRTPLSRGPKCRAVDRDNLHRRQLTRNSTRKTGQASKDARSGERDSQQSQNWNEKGPGPHRIALFDGSLWCTIKRCTEGMKVNMLFFCWYGASLEERTIRELQMMQEPQRKERLVGTSQGCHWGICQCVHLDPCSDQAFVHSDRCFSCLIFLPFSLLLSLSRRDFPQSIPPWCVGQLVMLQLQHRAGLKRSFPRLR